MGCLTCLENRCSLLLGIPLGRQARLLKASSIRTFQGLFSKIFSKAVPKVHFIQFPSTFSFLPEQREDKQQQTMQRAVPKVTGFPKAFQRVKDCSRGFPRPLPEAVPERSSFSLLSQSQFQGQGQGSSASALTTSLSRGLRQSKKYTRPGSNWQPSACEAVVIATRPLVPRVFFRVWNSVV